MNALSARPYSLHPQMGDIAAMLKARGLAPADPQAMPLELARAAQRRYHAVWNEDRPQIHRVTDLAADVPIRLFVPTDAQTHAVIVYFHGGGFVLNGVDTYERLLRLLALRTGAAVAAVTYRLAPEARFPSQLDDALAALAWLRAHGQSLGLDIENLAVAGDSAGANLALAATIALRDQGLPVPRAGLLAYGMFGADLTTRSHRELGDGRYGLSTARVDWFWRQYLADHAQRDNPLAAPLWADLDGLPPMHLIAAELDCLSSDTELMVNRLRDAGTKATLTIYQGVPHSFLQMSSFLQPADDAISQGAGFLRHHLG